MFSLAGKKALITGAGSSNGIGFASARALRELGAEVFITSTTERIHERAKEIGAQGFVADLTNEAEVKALVNAISSLDL